MKKKMFLSLAVCALVLPILANAASQGYSSYLILPADQQVEGDPRSYDYSNHKVSVSVDEVRDRNNPYKVVISLNKKNLIGSTQQARKTVSFTEGQTFTTVMGNYGSGKKWYGFGSYQNALYDGNSGHGTVYSGLNSDNVVMTSYN